VHFVMRCLMKGGKVGKVGGGCNGNSDAYDAHCDNYMLACRACLIL